MALLEVHQLTKNYARHSGWLGARQEKCVVDRVSFSIARGETLGLVGESGSGKSTVARMILGLIPPTSGTVSFAGEEVIHGASNAKICGRSVGGCNPCSRIRSRRSIRV